MNKIIKMPENCMGKWFHIDIYPTGFYGIIIKKYDEYHYIGLDVWIGRFSYINEELEIFNDYKKQMKSEPFLYEFKPNLIHKRRAIEFIFSKKLNKMEWSSLKIIKEYV